MKDVLERAHVVRESQSLLLCAIEDIVVLNWWRVDIILSSKALKQDNRYQRDKKRN